MFKRLTQQVQEVDEQLNLGKNPYSFKVLQRCTGYLINIYIIGLCKTLKKHQLFNITYLTFNLKISSIISRTMVLGFIEVS